MHLTLRTGAVLALFSLAAAPAQTTIVVDQNNGPGTNFTRLQPAIDAASPGDVIVVRTGSYQAFTLDKGVAIVAEQFTSVDGRSVVHDVPAGETASFVNIFLGTLVIRDCVGPVLGDVLLLAAPSTPQPPADNFVMEIRNCADVRMRQLGMNPGSGSGRDGLRVFDSRVTFDGGAVDGALGPEVGGTGLLAGAGSDVTVAFSRVRGGNQGPGALSTAGVGIHVASGGRVTVDGTEENEVFGGFGGVCGSPGAAVFLETGSSFRTSPRIEIEGGSTGCGNQGPTFDGPGTPVIANPPDLSMIFSGGISQVGVPSQVIVVGDVGEEVFLMAGVEATITPLPAFQTNPLLIVPLIAVPLGPVQPDGNIVLSLTVPPALPPGVVTHLQAASIRNGSTLHLSNAAVLVTGL